MHLPLTIYFWDAQVGVVLSTSNMKMKFPTTDGRVVIMKVDQKVAQKCYEINLCNQRGSYALPLTW